MVFIALVLCSNNVQAQDFNSAVGLRLGFPWSVTYKKFISESNALEGYAGIRPFGAGINLITANGAYLIHQDVEGEGIEGLQWYYGGGAGAYFWTGFGSSSTSLGISGYIGASYTLKSNPINISLDWVPTFFINGVTGFGSGFAGGYGNLAVRYILDPK